MATAEELLAQNQCDDILDVDLESRRIIIPSTVTNLGTESDSNVRVLHFRVPRHYCEIDLADFAIRINYKNTSGAGGYYNVLEQNTESDTILFDWVVARRTVSRKGDVIFNVCLQEITDGEVGREFNTTIATLPVLEGLTPPDVDDGSDEVMYDFIEQLKEHLIIAGSGDMLSSVYDPKGMRQDIFAYVDKKIEDVLAELPNSVTETWTFELANGSTITKEVMVEA